MDLSLLYFPSAVALGALHALEPGHAKTLTAAFLIGTKGTKRDATILGLSVATTHSLIVVLLSVVAISIGREAFAGEASYYLSIGSGVLVILLGAWLLTRRIKALRRANEILLHHHSHAPDPVAFNGKVNQGFVSIIDTALGERFEMKLSSRETASTVVINIDREGSRKETHTFKFENGKYLSENAPAEPHEFSATLEIKTENGEIEAFPFSMHEPEHHHHHSHDHAILSDEEHAKSHAADLPDYVQRGERPTTWQIIAFGAAGGLVPCPAAVSVMLLALSVKESGKGLLLVLGFGIGLAVTLVGVGLIVVAGLSKLSSQGRFSKLTAYAPAISAGLVMMSGLMAIAVAAFH